MRRIKFFFLALACLFFCSGLLFAEEPQLKVTVDKPSARLNEEIHLNVKITGIRGSLSAPRLPALQAFEVFYSGRASHFSFVNGQSQSMTEFNYVLIPKSTGTFVVRPIEISVENQVYRSEPVEIRIEDAPNALPSQPASSAPSQFYRQSATTASPPSAMTASPPSATTASPPSAAVSNSTIDGNIFLRVSPTKRSLYANEQLILNYSLLTRFDTRYEGFEEEPETSGFWIEEFPMERDIGRDTEVVNGKKYVRADIKKLALFPTAPGRYTIKPGVIKTSIQIEEGGSSLFDEFFNDSFFSGGGLFARRVEKRLTHAPIEIEVKPLPEAGKPKSFEGAVGEFRMTTDLDKRAVKQNEPVTLTVTLEGEGNIETLAPPKLPEIPAAKTYPSDTKTERFSQRDRVAGRKVLEFIIIPQEAGELNVPGLEFSFFNPRIEQYVILKTDPYHIAVEASKEPPPAIPFDFSGTDESVNKKEIHSEGEDIQYLKLSLAKEPFPSNDFLILLAAGNAILTFLCIGIAFAKRRNEFLNQNISLKRSLFARKAAQQGFSRLRKLAKGVSTDAKKAEIFYEACSEVLSQYLADKLGLSAQSLTSHRVQEELERRGIAQEVIREIRDFFDLCDQIRFGKMALTGAEPDRMIQKVSAVIEAVEKK